VPSIDCIRQTTISRSSRIRQLEGMFDIPATEKSKLSWSGDVPLDDKNWNVGLIVGPSGSGKTVVASELFGETVVNRELQWKKKSVIDDFDKSLNMKQIAMTCQSVGFNTIPAWMRPYAVLSNGEKFRVELARKLLEFSDPIVVDEFTSVVDRQVAKIGSHAVQKYIRKNSRKFVAVSCHYDIVDWLQPDWILEPATMTFHWRCHRRRPEIECVISPVDYVAWKMFSKYHYLTSEMNRCARCFVLFVKNQPAAFVGVLTRPVSVRSRISNVMGISRAVTLPDWQGLGLIFVAMEMVAAIYAGIGKRMRMYPAHPAFIRSFYRSENWKLIKKPGKFTHLSKGNTEVREKRINVDADVYIASKVIKHAFGGRPNAVFEYTGKSISNSEARKILSYWEK